MLARAMRHANLIARAVLAAAACGACRAEGEGPHWVWRLGANTSNGRVTGQQVVPPC